MLRKQHSILGQLGSRLANSLKKPLMNGRKSPVNDSMAIGLLADMKKCLIWILLLGAGFSLFAQTNSNASIFIPPVTGIGKTENDNTVIAQMLTNEIKSRHGSLGKSLREADFILYGTLAPYHEEQQYYHDYIFLNAENATDITAYTYNATLRDAWQQVYIFQLILKNEKTNRAVLLQNILYLSIEDVYDFFPLLIFNVFTQINAKQTSIKRAPAKQVYTDTEDWRNKWLYLRASFDFPITFYKLKSDDLVNGTKAYDDTDPNNIKYQQLDNIAVALPAMTVGAEVQLLDWLSIEPNVQVGWENLNDKDFINLAIGLQLKFPLKFISNIMLEPYGAVSYPVFPSSSGLFDSFPKIALGGGFQLGMKGWRNTGSVFIDVNYMYYCLGDAGINNPYKDYQPAVIHYQRTVLGLGIGYKFGVISRR